MAKKSVRKVTWAQACRDIVIASINKGQLPLLGLFVLLFTLFYRMPSDQVATFTRSLLDAAQGHRLTGYIFGGVSIGGWIFHVRLLRIQFGKECGRLGEEKSSLQIIAASKKPGASL